MEARKRGRPDAALNGNGGVKRNKQDMESMGIGSKSKPCTKFFSTAGCPFGEGCHFLHYVQGGLSTVQKMLGVNPSLPMPSRNPVGPPSVPNGATPALKTRLCNKMNSPEGCKFGDKCHFAHGQSEIGKPIAPNHEGPHAIMGGPVRGGMQGRMDPPPPGHNATAGFGASATAKISVDASLAGAIIGKGGINSKHICTATGVKLSIREHESDPNLRNIELEGNFEQIEKASILVRELILSINLNPRPPKNPGHAAPPNAAAASNFKTKLCENFTKGSCTFAERCHFAHGASELRKTGV